MSVLKKHNETEWKMFHLCLSLVSNEYQKGLYYHTVREIVEGMKALNIPVHVHKSKYWHTFNPIPLEDLLAEYNTTIADFILFRMNPVWLSQIPGWKLCVLEEYTGENLRKLFKK